MMRPLWLLPAVLVAAPCLGQEGGLYSAGNVDGVLTWALGDIAPGQAAAETVILAWGESEERLGEVVAEARGAATAVAAEAAPTVGGEEEARVWLENGVTDFGLEGAGLFRWRMERQALGGPHGGQLSQFTWYVHYTDDAGEKQVGIQHIGDSLPEGMRVVEGLRKLGDRQARVDLETLDGMLGIEVTAALADGPWAALRVRLDNRGQEALGNVRLSVYANLEAAHTHEGDLSILDRRLGGLVVVDPPTGVHVAMVGLAEPASGWSGTWNSLDRLQTASGLPFAEWKSLSDPSPALAKELVRARAIAMAPPGIYLPYIHDNPTTPETRRLTEAEAEDALVRDWLFQAEGRPALGRARQEIGWARELAVRLAGRHAPALEDLAKLQKRIEDANGTGEEQARELYLEVRRVKRRIMLSNPALDFSKLVFIDQPMPSGPVNDIHEAIHRMGITATPGGRLLVLDGLHPGGAVTQLAPERPGSFWRPDVSFDGKRVLFCYKAHDAKSFCIYEMALDGGGLTQLTDSDYDDVDPLYTPSGHILFTTTRGNSYVRCGPFIYSYTLARCDPDGGNVYLTSRNGEPDFVPSLMEDGRVIYSRWEYTDRPLWRIQSLWTTHPDGTNTRAFWGNRSVWPDHLSEPRQIPGSRKVIFSGVGHHDWWSGSIGIIDPAKGRDYPDGLTKVTADRPWPECSQPPEDPIESPDYHTSGGYTGYKSPYPLTEEDFLVSARGAEGKFRLYLMDVRGNRELIYEGTHNALYAMPVTPRPVPPELPSDVIWPGTGAARKPVQPGALYSSSIYEGEPSLPRGSVKYLRVFQLDHKTYSTWRKTYRHSGPLVSIVQEEGVKRILSEVPVEEDGSVYFEVPAGVSLYFQLLDKDRRCLQTMRSFSGVMPGEKRGCVGCHEQHSTAPPAIEGLALRRAPTPPSPPPWGTESVSYERFAQPVLDRHCGKCHQAEGKARETLDLTLRPAHGELMEPYLTLVGAAGWGNPVGGESPGYGIAGALPVESIDPTMNDPEALDPIPPMTSLSYASPLIERCMSGEHHGVRVDGEDLWRLMAWVDACCPLRGEPEVRAIGDPDFPGIEMLPIRPRVATAPVVERP